MSEATVSSLIREAVMATLSVSLPMLLVSLVVGLAVSIFQAVTQISEMTLTFVPKLLGLFAVLVIFGPWMLHRLLSFTNWAISLLPQLVR